MEIKSYERFKTQKELSESILQLMSDRGVKKTHIAREFKRRNIAGSTYPTILKKLDKPDFKFSEIVVLCELLQCDLKELLIKNVKK